MLEYNGCIMDKKIIKLQQYLEENGFKKESEMTSNLIKYAFTPDILSDPDLSKQTADYLVDVDDDNFAVMARNFFGQLWLEILFELPSIGYYVGDALWKGDYAGAGAEGLAAAVPFVPKPIASRILRFILPRRWQSLNMLNDALRAEGLSVEVSDSIRKELNRRHKKFLKKIDKLEKKKMLSTKPSRKKILGDKISVKKQKAEDILHSGNNTRGSYVYEPNSGSAIFRGEFASIDQISINKRMKNNRFLNAKIPANLSKADVEDILLDIGPSTPLYEELRRNLLSNSNHQFVFDTFKHKLNYRMDGLRKEIAEHKSKIIRYENKIADVKNIMKSKFGAHPFTEDEIRDLSAEEIIARIRYWKRQNIKTRDYPSDIIAEMKKIENALTPLSSGIRNSRSEIRNGVDAIEVHIPNAIKIVDSKVAKHLDVARKRTRGKVFSEANKIGKMKEVDMRNLPDFYRVRLKNRPMEVYKIDEDQTQIILTEMRNNPELKLPSTFKLEGEDLFHSPQGIPISMIETADIVKIQEISRINHHNQADLLVETVTFLD